MLVKRPPGSKENHSAVRFLGNTQVYKVFVSIHNSLTSLLYYACDLSL